MAKRVVVVGGGFAGSFIAKQLVKHTDLVEVTLIDTKEYFEHTPAVMREIVTYAVHDGNMENEAPSTVLEHSAYLHPKGKLIVGEVVDVSATDVTINVFKTGSSGNYDSNSVVESNTVVPFDFLCICTGNNYPGFVRSTACTIADRHKEYKKQGDLLRKAETILIIGGEVALVSSSPNLLNNLPQKAQIMAHQYLEFCGTRLFYNQAVTTLQLPRQEIHKILGQRSYIPLHIQNMEEGTVKYTTSKGIFGTAEKVYYCSGGNPKTSFMMRNFFQQLDDDFKLKVNDFLQLDPHAHIFAAGDITHHKEEKLAERALKQAEVIVENILSCAKGLLPKVKYMVQPQPGLQVISLGTATGTLSMWGEVVSAGRVAASSKESFLAYHCAALLSNANSLYATTSVSSGMVIDSPTIISKVANCKSRIAVLGTHHSGGMSSEVVKYLAKHGTMSVIIVPHGTVVRLSKNIH